MIHYAKNVTIVMRTLTKYQYSKRNMHFSKCCYARLQRYLEDEKCSSFTGETAKKWCDVVVTGFNHDRCMRAVQRLIDVYEDGYVHAEHLNVYGIPSASFQADIDNYTASISHRHTVGVLNGIKNACKHFCCFAQCNGAFSVDELDYTILNQYYEFVQSTGTYKNYCNYAASFLKYLAENGRCSHGYSLMLNNDYQPKCISYEKLSREGKSIIGKRIAKNAPLSSKEFLDNIPYFINQLKLFQYSENYLSFTTYQLKLLYLFLDRAGLGYDREIANIWIKEAEKQSAIDSSKVRYIRRTLDLYDDYVNEGSVRPEYRMRYMPGTYNTLPIWCKTEIDRYVAAKRKEGKSEGTINGCITDISKFCAFIVSNGIRSFAELTPAIIKQFNIKNNHLAHSTKKSRNSNVRSFLMYMEINNLLQEGLRFALTSITASREKIVKVLSDADQARINSYCTKASTVIELRDAAIIQIGMSTALRASDVLALRMSDIDWKARIIKVVQRKTKLEHTHATDANTLNAVFRYLKDGRYKNADNDFIFISVRAPYSPLTYSACCDALKRAGSSTTDFHRLRRTYASDSLKNGATISETAELLGHSNQKTVHKYIVLDEERMRLCPLSLAETGLTLERRYDNG